MQETVRAMAAALNLDISEDRVEALVRSYITTLEQSDAIRVAPTPTPEPAPFDASWSTTS